MQQTESPANRTEILQAVPGNAPLKALLAGDIPLDRAWGGALTAGLVLLQCAVLYWIVHRFKIETELFQLIFGVALVGFVIHHLLPMRFRLPFFLALSMGLLAYCLGLERAEWKPLQSLTRGGLLFGIGFVLVLICRLRIRWGYRVGLLVAAGAGLALFRTGWMQFGALDAIWPVLGGIFMYRIAGYIYDLEHEKERTSLVQACSYFFLFPNVWLFVFPMIDYKTFIKEYYSQDPVRIYQRGLQWMMRGILQLLIWRFVYYQLYVDPARITNGAELAQFLLANVALYLRVTGQFHFAIGLLHLFGFHLPETNKRFFLASDFVDYWRRANIYMKDFLMKICYYPLVLRFKKLGTKGSVVAAIGGTFVLTWFLHPYQWFWIRGVFPITPKDAVFWTLLGAGVIYSALRGMNPKKAAAGPWQTTLRTAPSVALTFTIITIFWSIWTCDTLEQWVGIWKFADGKTLLYASAAWLVLMVAYVLIESPVRPFAAAAAAKKPVRASAPVYLWKPAAVACLAPAALLIAGTTDQAFAAMRPDVKEMVKSLFWNTPNKSGEEFMVRGYYEGLMDMQRVSPMLDQALAQTPSDWKLLEDTPAVRVTNDLRTRDLVPSTNLTINEVPFSTNSAGLRDREYSLVKPEGVTRIALLGSSITMGWNVPKERTFEALFEEEVNRELGSSRVEVLNFAVNGYSIVSLVEQLEQQVVAFKPDIVMVVSHPEDPGRASYMLAKALAAGADARYDYLRDLLARTGVQATDPRNRMETKLAPHEMEMTTWAYQQLVRTSKAHGAEPWLVFLPGVLQRSTGALDRQLVDVAGQAGFQQVLPLHQVYSAEDDRASLAVAPWDAHPNEKGHRMVANELLRQVRQRGLLGLTAREQK